jgi:hypothetical protein
MLALFNAKNCSRPQEAHLGPHKAVILAAVVTAAAFAVMFFVLPPANDGLRSVNNGFGPDWECTSHALSEPTCIKKLQR